MADASRLLDQLVGMVWVAALGATAAAALWRFRFRPAGLLLGLGFGLLAGKSLVMPLLYLLVFADVGYDSPARRATQLASWALTLVLSALVVAGVALIPASATEPSRSGTPEPRVPADPSTRAR